MYKFIRTSGTSVNRKKEKKKALVRFLGGNSILLLLFAISFSKALHIATVLCFTSFVLFLLTSKSWMISKRKGIPVLMFHSVTDTNDWLPWPHLSLRVAFFKDILLLLKNKGYKTVSLLEVKSHIEGKTTLPEKTFSITFDDGYLDNWVYAYPLLEEIGFRATLFVATDFIEKRNIIRPQIRSQTNIPKANLAPKGYLSIVELRRMKERKIFDIECHTSSHTWLFKNSVLKKFVKPGDIEAVWLFWNLYKNEKPTWHISFRNKQKHIFGHPVYGYERSHLVTKAFYPSIELIKRLNKTILSQGEETFFQDPDWQQKLRERYLELLKKFPGRWETNEEVKERLTQEIYTSKKVLEKYMEGKIHFLCWPGEKYTEEGLSMAINKFGFVATTGGQGRNTQGEDPRLISRMYVKSRYTPFFNSLALDKFLFYADLKVFEGNYYFYLISSMFSLLKKFEERVKKLTRNR